MIFPECKVYKTEPHQKRKKITKKVFKKFIVKNLTNNNMNFEKMYFIINHVCKLF